MKPLICRAGLIVAAMLASSLGTSSAQAEISVGISVHAESDFYEPLTPYGGWVEVGGYGRCWHPARVAVGWRPYCEGHWEWTDCGWYWVSDEPWGWACYHYGSWVDDPVVGWVWVPGLEWAPAWVSWRVGGGYIGWAPLPPRHLVVGVRPAPFFFVEERRIHERVTPSTVIVNNTTIINKTTVINNMRQETRSIGGGAPQKVMINEGPSVKEIQSRTGKSIAQVPVQQVAMKNPMPPAMEKHQQEQPHPSVPTPTGREPKELPKPSQPAHSTEPSTPTTPEHGTVEKAPETPHPAPATPETKRRQGRGPRQPVPGHGGNPGQERKHE